LAYTEGIAQGGDGLFAFGLVKDRLEWNSRQGIRHLFQGSCGVATDTQEICRKFLILEFGKIFGMFRTIFQRTQQMKDERPGKGPAHGIGQSFLFFNETGTTRLCRIYPRCSTIVDDGSLRLASFVPSRIASICSKHE
jgi:hypothetical protein